MTPSIADLLRRPRGAVAAVAGAVIVLSALVSATLGTAAQAASVRYLAYPGTPEVYRVEGDAAVHLTWADYVAAGRPAVQLGWIPGSQLVKLPWAAEVYVINPAGSGHHVTAAEYPLLGRSPVAPAIRYLAYPDTSEVYAAVDWPGDLVDATVHLTWSQYVAAGTPSPVFGWIPGSELAKVPWAPEVFVVNPAGSPHHLTAAEYQALGRAPEQPKVRYLSYPGTGSLYAVTTWPGDIGTSTEQLTATERVAAGSPQASFGWIPGSQLIKLPWQDQVYAVDPDGGSLQLTLTQFTALKRSPVAPPIRFWRVPGQTQVNATIDWPGTRATETVAVTWAQYVAAGYPAVVDDPALATGRSAATLRTLYGNGRIPAWELCGVPWRPAERVACDALSGLVALDAAYFAEFGERLPIDESYRDYDTQVLYRQLYGAYAAVPGTSNHGWAAAIDLPDHRFADDRAYSWFGHTDGWTFDGEKYLWLRANGPALGWVHPRAMEPGGGGPQEPWHFEWAPGTA